MDTCISRASIETAYRIIAPHVRVTPIFQANGRDFGGPAFPLTFKLEQLQFAGSFKTRGAFANLLLRQVPVSGVVAASGGNHGAAVAYAAMCIGCPARIFVPTVSSQVKIDRIRAYGAELCITGDRYADALEASEAWAETSGALQVHAFDQRETLLGQGTLALELSAQAPDIDTLLVAVGGGGLIAGVAAWHRGGVRVIGVEPCAAPTLTNALRAGCPVDAPAGGLAADSLAPRRVGDAVFPIAKAYVEDVILVDDADIACAQEALWDGARLVAEPGGAAAFAAFICGAYKPRANERLGVIISGGNTNAVRLNNMASSVDVASRTAHSGDGP
jgi:threonine dehydratase